MSKRYKLFLNINVDNEVVTDFDYKLLKMECALKSVFISRIPINMFVFRLVGIRGLNGVSSGSVVGVVIFEL